MPIKIMGANYDDLAKLMGADLIVAGTAVAGEVKTGETFYAGSTVLITGNGTQTLNPANENVPAGYYTTTTLSAVDGDLAPGNIAEGVTIFGFLGTFAATIVHDDQDNNVTGTGAQVLGDGSQTGTIFTDETSLRQTASITLAQDSVIEAWGGGIATFSIASAGKIRLYIDDVQVAESAFLVQTGGDSPMISLMGNRAASSGARTVKVYMHNYGANGSLKYCLAAFGGCTKT